MKKASTETLYGRTDGRMDTPCSGAAALSEQLTNWYQLLAQRQQQQQQ